MMKISLALYGAEFPAVRAEFRLEYAIFVSSAEEQNMPIYEQNLSTPTRSRKTCRLH